jgi:hypothetical protein
MVSPSASLSELRLGYPRRHRRRITLRGRTDITPVSSPPLRFPIPRVPKVVEDGRRWSKMTIYSPRILLQSQSRRSGELSVRRRQEDEMMWVAFLLVMHDPKPTHVSHGHGDEREQT